MQNPATSCVYWRPLITRSVRPPTTSSPSQWSTVIGEERRRCHTPDNAVGPAWWCARNQHLAVYCVYVDCSLTKWKIRFILFFLFNIWYASESWIIIFIIIFWTKYKMNYFKDKKNIILILFFFLSFFFWSNIKFYSIFRTYARSLKILL